MRLNLLMPILVVIRSSLLEALEAARFPPPACSRVSL